MIGVVVLTLIAGTLAFGYPCAGSPLGQLSFLVGHWVGEPQGQAVFQGFPGVLQSGDFTAMFDLDRWVLILRGGSGTDERPLHVTLQDMMVVYSGCGTERGTRAIYVDGTHHTVHYCTFDVLYSPNRSKPNGVTFVSVPEPNIPTFRLTYTEITQAQIGIELKMGQRTYKSTARRTAEH